MPDSLLEQADLQQALQAHVGESRPLHVLAHDYGDSVAQELIARHQEGRLQLASCVFLNGGLFPRRIIRYAYRNCCSGRLGADRAVVSRRKLAQSFARIFGRRLSPARPNLDALWQLVAYNNGSAVMHRLIRYMPERRQQRQRWVSAMQAATPLPMRVIDAPSTPSPGRIWWRATVS